LQSNEGKDSTKVNDQDTGKAEKDNGLKSTTESTPQLKQEQDKISSNCKEDLSRVFQSNQQLVHRGGGALSGLGGFGITPNSSPSITYEGRLTPNQSSTSISENKINFSTPLYKGGSHSLSLSTQGSALHLGQTVSLNTGTVIPRDYYRTELGTNYMQILPEKKIFGVRGAVGYNTDKPFTSGRDLSFSLSSHYGFSNTDHSSWALTLHLSNNGPLTNGVPIPGFIYFYRSSSFTGMFGFPFASLQWTPSFPWTYSISLFGLNLNSEVAFGSIEKIQYFSGFSWNRQSYMLHDRTNEKDRLTFEEKKLFLGMRTPLFNKLSSELQLGDSFGRKVYIGNKLLNKDGGEEKLGSGLYASWMMKMIF
jgi:hypothetical protein